jgi:outer membrane protein TolC
VGTEEDDAAVTHLLEQPLTAEAAEQVALLNNRRLRAVLRRLPRGGLVQAGLLPNPTFSVEARVSQEPNTPPQWDLDLSYDFSRLILRGEAVAAAGAELDAAKLEAAQVVLDVVFTVRTTLFALQAAQRKLELLTQSAQAATASYETAKVLFDAGNLAARDLLLYQADDEEARLRLLEQRSLVVELEEEATGLMGLHGRAWTAAALPEVPPAIPELDRAETKAIDASLELQAQKALLSATAHRLGYTRLDGVLPDLGLAVHAERFGPYWEVGPALRGRFPLFDRNQGHALTLEGELAALKESYLATAVEVRAAARAAKERLRAAATRAKQQREVLAPLRKRVLEETLKTYNAMHVSVFELLQARKAQWATDMAYADASLDYWRARAALDTLLAGRLVKLKEKP